MQAIATPIDDLLILEPRVFGDDRGFFFESFNQQRFADVTGLHGERMPVFIQDNHSKSSRNVLRGLHYQIGRPQAKLVRVIAGEIFDVVVDMRRSSATFGKWFGLTLSAENKRQLWVPAGFAHGFVVTSDSAECVYKITDYWLPEHERCLLWNDPAIGIEWPIDSEPLLSAKDRVGSLLRDADAFP